MGKKLKRSLFIGLGGTGLKSIVHTKKRFMDTYGEIPPMVGFMAFDTDNDGINFKLKSQLSDQEIGLERSEFLHTMVRNPQDILKQQPDLFDFVPKENEPLLVSLVNGAGQVRSNGRFATHFNYNQIEHAIHTKLTKILNADSITNDKYEVNGNDVEINMMFSVAGGTGSGTFIDMAYIVKEVSKNINATVGVSTIGFAILPDVFNIMMTGPAMQNVLPNGYGALHDLDYLMDPSIKDKGLEINYESKTISIDSPPFDLVFTINNIDKNANTYTKVNDLSELIGLAMFTGASELSGSMVSSYDNVRAVIAGGQMKVEDKHSWACGLGLSELFFDGNKLGNIYAHKASMTIVNNLITPESESFNLDDVFIDNAKIRENNGDENNELIDALLTQAPRIPYSYIQDDKNPETETSAYLQNVEDTANKEIEENYETKKKDVENYLESYIIEQINKASGVGNVDKFLKGLDKHVNLFLQEMQLEQKELTKKNEFYKNQLDQNIAELKGLSFIERKLGSRFRDTKDDIIQSTNNVAFNIHECLRRQFAIQFFNNLIQIIKKYHNKIEDIKFKLNNVENSCESRAIGLQNQIDDEPKKFVKELHRDYVNKVVVKDTEININDFIKHLKAGNGLFDFSEVSEKMIETELWEFSKELPKALEYRNRKIDQVLADYSEEDLINITNELILKSNPLWSYDYKGYVVNKEHHEAFIIGVPQESKSVIKKKKILNNILQSNQNYDFNSTNMNDRIVIYRMEATAPVYAVSNMALYQEKNSKSKISHHIDENWVLKMEREGFGILPQKKEDHSLEYWVTGFIYGYIKFDGENYIAYSVEAGDPIDDYWVKLGKYRDEAFDVFKKLKLQDDLKTLIETKVSKMGEIDNQKLINDVTEGVNYREKYSQKDFETNDLKDSKMIRVRELFGSEIDFVTKVLAN